MTRLWSEGEPISVVSDATKAPRAFTWQGRTHQVEVVVKRWRVDVDWWRGRVWRKYFKLTTHTGLLVILFRDLLNGRVKREMNGSLDKEACRIGWGLSSEGLTVLCAYFMRTMLCVRRKPDH